MRRKISILWVVLGTVFVGFTIYSLDKIGSSIPYFNVYKPDVEIVNSEVEEQLFQFQHNHEDSDVVGELKENVRVLCWIMSGPNNTHKAMAVNATWAPRCNKYFFVTAGNGLPSVDLNVTAGRNHLFEKSKRAFKYLYDTDLNDYDWFLKADDDTFVIMENLRFMLLSYSPNDPIYFGCKFESKFKQGYMSGGAGYVLSREAVRRLVEVGLNDTAKCSQDEEGAEDVQIGKCLEAVNVVAGDARDTNGNLRMLPFEATALVDMSKKKKPGYVKWFYNETLYTYNKYKEPLSDYAISFHYINPVQMHGLFDRLYKLKVVGVTDSLDLVAKAEMKNNRKLIDVLRSISQNTSLPFSELVARRNLKSSNLSTSIQ
ncbi:N-acetylgalactosaminide beta-1,3-galactosyltransferase [Aphelenchoides besseyi]|nr:N-acetylgalactosaminide beta-1,3-galactosyltransferase [Aphelenchoides besseyi]